MKKRLLLIALATTMALSMFTGCGSNKEKEEDTTPTNNVEQSDNNDVENSTKEDSTKDEPIVNVAPSYDEEFYERPDFEKEYEEELAQYLAVGVSESSAEKRAKYTYDKNVRGYEVMKYVFEDMTRRFKNKEEVSVTDSIDIVGIPEFEGSTFVCDVTKIIPDDEDKTLYTEFCGFKAKKTEFNDVLDKKGYIVVELNANAMIEGKASPMWISVFVTINEDGTYSYKEINIQYML